MSAHRETELTPDTPELDVDVRRPGRMHIQVEFTPDEIKRLRIGVKAHADGVVAFIKNAALAEADRIAESRPEKTRESVQVHERSAR